MKLQFTKDGGDIGKPQDVSDDDFLILYFGVDGSPKLVFTKDGKNLEPAESAPAGTGGLLITPNGSGGYFWNWLPGSGNAHAKVDANDWHLTGVSIIYGEVKHPKKDGGRAEPLKPNVPRGANDAHAKQESKEKEKGFKAHFKSIARGFRPRQIRVRK